MTVCYSCKGEAIRTRGSMGPRVVCKTKLPVTENQSLVDVRM